MATAAAATVPVYEWIEAGEPVGCGTALELNHWTAEGIFVGTALGNVLTHEPASMDERRRVEWAQG